MAEDQETWRWVGRVPTTDVYESHRHTGDIILYESHLAVYKHSLDLIIYFVASPLENEIMLSASLTSLVDALTMLLRNSLEKRGVLENLDLVLLCLDETVDDGRVDPVPLFFRFAP